MGEAREVVLFYFPQVVQPHPASFLPANSLKASGNACDGASCPFCRASGLCCGGAGIPSGGGRRKGEEGTKVSPEGACVPEVLLPPLRLGPWVYPGHRETSPSLVAWERRAWG